MGFGYCSSKRNLPHQMISCNGNYLFEVLETLCISIVAWAPFAHSPEQ